VFVPAFNTFRCILCASLLPTYLVKTMTLKKLSQAPGHKFNSHYTPKSYFVITVILGSSKLPRFDLLVHGGVALSPSRDELQINGFKTGGSFIG
jgi:hypothetical protein